MSGLWREAADIVIEPDVAGFAYDAHGITIDTWGMTGTLTDKAIAKYCTLHAHGDVYTVVSQEAINQASQKAPNGFDWSQLIADFDSMGGNVAPAAFCSNRSICASGWRLFQR